MGSVAERTIEYRDTSITFRAPRVAIVIESGQPWMHWARIALHAASYIWGGSGFVLVPHKDGVVNPAILRAVRAYDPDYVVGLPISLHQFEAAHPGIIDKELERLRNEGAEIVAGTRAQIAATKMRFKGADDARKAVLDACSPYRMAMGEDEDVSKWEERLTILRTDDQESNPLTPIHRVRPTPIPRFGANSGLNSYLGVMAANHVGMVDEPFIEDIEVDPKHEVDFICELAKPRQSARVRSTWSCFEQTDTGDSGPDLLKIAWENSQIELGWVSDRRNSPVLYVVGDGPDDFCLALLWERIYGQAIWVPSELWREESSQLAGEHRQSLRHGMVDITTAPYGSDHCIISSASLDAEYAQDFRNSIFATESRFYSFDADGNPTQRDPREEKVDVLSAEHISLPSIGRYFLGLKRQFQRSDTLPMVLDLEGGTTLAASPPVPILDAPGLATLDVSFQIDLDIPRVTMPQSRAVPPAALMRTPDNYLERYDSWVRCGRKGVSYESRRNGLILSGVQPEEKLARPRIRKPGMLSWARWKARMSGYDLQVSDAGWPAHILAGLAGSRDNLTDAFTGFLQPALLEYTKRASGTRTSDVFDNKVVQKGCVVYGSVYLTMPGFFDLTKKPDDEADEVRIAVDKLLSTRILNRGVLLLCETCRVSNFYSVDQLGQSNTCPRCRSAVEFVQASWKYPAKEPDWCYDLHPLGRDLINAHGYVPLLLANFLRTKAQTGYADTPEVVVKQKSKTVAEADLIAVAGDELIVAETKSNDSLGNNLEAEIASVNLRLKLAEIFGADAVVMATTRNSWTERSLKAMRNAFDTYSWPNGLRPKLRTVTSLAAGGNGVETSL